MPYRTQAEKTAALRRWRARNPERVLETTRRWWAKNPEVYRQSKRGMNAVSYAIRMGRLVRPSECEECHTAGRVEAAHFNYVELLRVRWLCRSCHVRLDRAVPKAV